MGIAASLALMREEGKEELGWMRVWGEVAESLGFCVGGMGCRLDCLGSRV